MKKIFDRNGHLIGIFYEQPSGTIQVFDANNSYLGKVMEQGTFDKNNSLITRERIPGLLLDRTQ